MRFPTEMQGSNESVSQEQRDTTKGYHWYYEELKNHKKVWNLILLQSLLKCSAMVKRETKMKMISVNPQYSIYHEFVTEWLHLAWKAQVRFD